MFICYLYLWSHIFASELYLKFLDLLILVKLLNKYVICVVPGSAGDSKAPGGGNCIFKSSAVRVSVVKKKAVASNGSRPENENKREGEQKTNGNSGLLSLCQQYDSDEDD